MNCPICGKELELKNKQIGIGEGGSPIVHQYAICRSCRKQWDLDKQRAKKAAASKSAGLTVPESRTETEKKPVAEKPVSPKNEHREKKESVKEPQVKEEPVKKAPVKKAVKRRVPKEGSDSAAEEKRYSNIPPEKVRTKHETAARKGYKDMIATGTISKPSKKRSAQADDDTRIIEKGTVVKAERKKANLPSNPATPKTEPVMEEYDDDYYEDTPRFRVMRVLLAVLSLSGFGYLIYRGFSAGLSSAENGSVSGLTFVILALCLLVSSLLYFITLGTNSVFVFLLPILFYIGGGVLAFIKADGDFPLLVAAGFCAALAVLSLILAITSRDGGDYDDEYDDAFEDDYADDDYDK